MGREDREMKVKAQEDIEVETIVQEKEAAVEEEDGEDQGIEAQAQEVVTAAEEEENMVGEAVEPAMGKNENSAQRPKVMGGLL